VSDQRGDDAHRATGGHGGPTRADFGWRCAMGRRAEESAVTQPAVKEPARMLRLVGDEKRLRILLALVPGERSVGDLCSRMALPAATVSAPLSTLRLAGLVASRRDGKHVYYRLGRRARAAGPAALQVESEGLAIKLSTGIGGDPSAPADAPAAVT